MRELTFTINLDARFKRKPWRRPSTRELLWLSQRKKINPPKESADARNPDLTPAAPGAITGRDARKYFPTKPVWPGNAVHRVKHSLYKGYIISTNLRRNGTWVANYGRPKGPRFEIAGEERAVAETIPYLAETLAWAEACVAIDALVKSARHAGKPIPCGYDF